MACVRDNWRLCDRVGAYYAAPAPARELNDDDRDGLERRSGGEEATGERSPRTAGSGPKPWAAARIADAEWRSAAACRSADPELFFPISASGPAREQAAEAKAICAICRVGRECLTFALRTGQLHGIWGGTTEDERAAARRRTASEQAATKEPRPA
jgi:WhiB family redox-sensing transcriptional regulator